MVSSTEHLRLETKMFDSLGNGSLKSILSDRTPRILTESDINQLYMICAAKVTQQNWNEPGYTFIVITDEEANWLSIDSLVLSDFVENATTSVSFYPDYLNLLVNNDSFLDVEVLDQSEENEEEYINDAMFIAEESILEALDKTDVKLALIESLEIIPVSKVPFRKEVVDFILATLN